MAETRTYRGPVAQFRREPQHQTEDRYYLEHEDATLGQLHDWLGQMLIKHGESFKPEVASGGHKRGRYIRLTP